jgi:hypothetical protein
MRPAFICDPWIMNSKVYIRRLLEISKVLPFATPIISDASGRASERDLSSGQSCRGIQQYGVSSSKLPARDAGTKPQEECDCCSKMI